MTQDLIDAAVGLADLLARENEALSRRDLARAASMLMAKRRAASAFEEARVQAAHLRRAGPERRLAEEVGRRLDALAAENRRLLEHAVRVQGRVISVIAGALPRSGAHGYRADGAPAGRERARAFTFSARA